MQSKYPNVCVALLGRMKMLSPLSSVCSGQCAGRGSGRRGQSVHGRGLLGRLLPLAGDCLVDGGNHMSETERERVLIEALHQIGVYCDFRPVATTCERQADLAS
jgi:hypothetical protein